MYEYICIHMTSFMFTCVVHSSVNESRHIWMRHVAFQLVMSHTNESCHVWKSQVTPGFAVRNVLKRKKGRERETGREPYTCGDFSACAY